MISVARSKQAFTATLGKNHGHLGTFHGHKIFYHNFNAVACFLDGAGMYLIGWFLTAWLFIRNSSVDKLLYFFAFLLSKLFSGKSS
jgi:hypothetical protein